jgi:hypothetical protein
MKKLSNGYLETKFKVFRRSDDTIVDETEAYIKIDSIVGIARSINDNTTDIILVSGDRYTTTENFEDFCIDFFKEN